MCSNACLSISVSVITVIIERKFRIPISDDNNNNYNKYIHAVLFNFNLFLYVAGIASDDIYRVSSLNAVPFGDHAVHH